jgi:hypothetical protein
MLARRPYRRIATENAVSEAALRRHFDKHLPEHLAKAWQAERIASASDLLAELRELDARTAELLDQAQQQGHIRAALQAVAARRANIELLAKLRGALDRKAQTERDYSGAVAIYIPDNGRDDRAHRTQVIRRVIEDDESDEASRPPLPPPYRRQPV